MPIDTRQKRESAAYLLTPIYVPGVVPTGTIDGAERVASVFVYSGSAPAPGAGPSVAALVAQRYLRRRREG